MGSSWRTEILASVKLRDTHEKANVRMINEFTKLADKTYIRRIGSSSAVNQNSSSELQDALPGSSQAHLQQLRLDLGEAQRMRNTLATQLKSLKLELASLKEQATQSDKEVNMLVSERNALEKKVKDRDDEVRGHKKIIENLQDEILTLNIQLDLADQSKSRVMKENQELISRWMAYKAKEAEEMNNASNFS